MRPLSVTMFMLALFLCQALFFSPCAKAEDGRLDELEKEVKELRKENEEIKKKLKDIREDDSDLRERLQHEEDEYEELSHDLERLSKMVDVSGYAAAEFYHTDQENENDRFRVRYLSLFFTKEVQKQWKLFTEIEYEDAPKIVSNNSNNTVRSSQGSIFVEQLYIEYHPSLEWDLRFGRVNTPAGLWSIYHYPPYVPFQTSPLFYKIIFPEVTDGVQLRNSFSSKDSALDTHFYIGNGNGNPGSGDRNENKGIGARVNAEMLEGFNAGASYYRETDNQGVVKTSYGLHLLLNFSPVRFQSEYATRHNDPEAARSFNDSGLYAQLSYDIGLWTVAARYDWFDSNDTDKLNDRYRYSGAFNYHFAQNVLGKFEYNRNEFDDPATKDYNEFIMGIVVAIGDL